MQVNWPDKIMSHLRQDGTNGRLAVVGSVHMISDGYLEKENNDRVVDVVFQWLAGGIQLNAIDADAPDIADYHFLPSTKALSIQPRVCLQDGDEVCGLKPCLESSDPQGAARLHDTY